MKAMQVVREKRAVAHLDVLAAVAAAERALESVGKFKAAIAAEVTR